MAEEIAAVESVLRDRQAELLERWVAALSAGPGLRRDLLGESELRFLSALAEAVGASQSTATTGPEWDAVREQLTALSRSRATQGFTPTETATFIFSLKEPLAEQLQARYGDDAAGLARALWSMTAMLDQLGLFTADAYLRSREDVIRRQQDELIELSTPVVKLWEGVVAVPLIGTLDSARTQVVMESLLERIVATDSTIAIIDITGVPTVDTLVAQHLLKTVAAARLMGADCIISGIRPQIAQTIVHLGLDLSEVTTKASLADAVVVALERTGYEIVRRRTAGT